MEQTVKETVTTPQEVPTQAQDPPTIVSTLFECFILFLTKRMFIYFQQILTHMIGF